MENATKALLIAAGVLIAIVIVAVGVNLLSSTGDTTEHAENVGNALKDAIGSASDNLRGDLELDIEDFWNDKLGKTTKIADYFAEDYKLYLYQYDGPVEEISRGRRYKFYETMSFWK